MNAKLFLLVFGPMALSCAPGPGADADGRTGTVRQAILRGTASDESQNAVVMLVAIDPATNTRLGICTAAMIAPRLALTARHCVSDNNGGNIACEANGNPLVGGEIRRNFDASSFYVFTGKDRPPFVGDDPPFDPTKWKPAGQGAEILDDGAQNLCDHDLAMVLLKEPILGIPYASIRLDRGIASGEKLLTVGWGVTSGEVEPRERQQRSGVTVKRVGPDDAIPVLTKSEFLFDESICLGDSGGPIFSAGTNAILGVVSRGGNGLDPSAGGPASTCTEADNVGTKLGSFRGLVLDAFKRAGAEPILEPAPEDTSGCGLAGHPSLPARLPIPLVALSLTAIVVRRRRSRHPIG